MSMSNKEKSLWQYCGIHSDEEKKAKKEHSCSWCGKIIGKKERYHYINMDFEVFPHNRRIKLCMDCYSQMHIHKLIEMSRITDDVEIRNVYLPENNNQQQYAAQKDLMSPNFLKIGNYVTFYDENDTTKTGVIKFIGEKGVIVTDEGDKWIFKSFKEIWPALISETLLKELGFYCTGSFSKTWFDIVNEERMGPTTFLEYQAANNGYKYLVSFPISNVLPSVFRIIKDNSILDTRHIYFMQQLQYLTDVYWRDNHVGITGDVNFVISSEDEDEKTIDSPDDLPT